jgi:Protein kinase domain
VSELVLESTFAGCRIEGVAGRGGMGVVYRATQLPLGRKVALKVVAPERAADATFQARFERETRVAAAIDHPNVIPVYEAGESEGRLYLVMRWVQGGDLQQLIAQSGGLEPAHAAEIVAQVGYGLEAAHAAGLVHRDVKPANVLIAGDEGSGNVYLTDFGLTLETTSDVRITQTGEWIGTADFMAPEQFEGSPVDTRTDVYALGCVLYSALTGRPPFKRDTFAATMLAHLRDPSPRPSAAAGVPEAFDGVVQRALAKPPGERYSSAEELAEATLAAAGLPKPERRTEVSPRTVAHNGNGRGDATTAVAAGSTVALPSGTAAPTARLTRPRRRFPRLAFVTAALGTWVAAAVLVGVELIGTGSASGAVTGGDVRGAVNRFSRAYASEDDDELKDVLAKDVARVTPGDSQRGRGPVVREYRRQFAINRMTGYEVNDLDVHAGKAGRASGRYVATRSGARPITGRIVFGVHREDGRAKIGLVAVTPDR